MVVRMTPAMSAIAACFGMATYAAGRSSAAAAAGPRPAEAALFAYDEQRLAIVEFRTGALRFVSEPDAFAHEPVWSPTGARLSYRIDEQLMVHVDGVSPDRPFFAAPGFRADRPYVYSPDEKWIAASLPDGVALLRLPANTRAPVPGESRQTPLPGCGIPDLLATPDGTKVLALCAPGGQKRVIVGIDVETQATSTQPADGVVRMLGWQRDGTLLVAAAHATTGEEPATLSPSGKLHRLHVVEDGEFIVAALRDPGQIVLAMGNEGDIGPTILRLAGPTRDSSMPWLREFGSIDDINFTRDGSWALFVKPVRGGRQGGDVYLAATGSEQATRVLASTADRSYASPVPRPLGRR